MVIRDSVRVSKSLSWLLRHGAVKENMVLDSEGYAEMRFFMASIIIYQEF